MAETFSPVRPRVRWSIPSLVSAIKVCGLAAPKTAAAAADFRNERLLTVASVGLGGSDRLVSSTIVLINLLPWVVRWVRLVAVSIVRGFKVVVPREVVVNSGKIFAATTIPNCQAIEFLRRIRQRHGCPCLVGAHRGQVQILLQPAQWKVRLLIISVLDSLAFQGEERRGCWPAQECFKQNLAGQTEGLTKNQPLCKSGHCRPQQLVHHHLKRSSRPWSATVNDLVSHAFQQRPVCFQIARLATHPKGELRQLRLAFGASHWSAKKNNTPGLGLCCHFS